MPSIIPDPGPPPAVEPITEEITFDNSYSIIPAGAQIYATDIFSIFFLLDANAPITNNGTLWLQSNGVFAWLGRNPDLINTGLIYLHGNGIAELSPLGDYLSNSGSIFAISDTSGARVIDSDVLPVFVANSGLLAAQSLGINNTPDDEFLIDYAITIDSNGSLQLINDVPGRILAEAPHQAIAVSAPSGEVHNLGLIEANATGPDGTSVGIYIWESLAGTTITNSGTIRADIAIYGASDSPFAVESVENQASGMIDGFVSLGSGNDSFVNNGTLIGDVDMGDGQDVFSGSGSVSGAVDMGFGNDAYTGSAGGDRAYGGRDSDNLGGAGGNDQLFGGFGNDTLHGDAGNDALIGEWGNDTVLTLGGDYVEGGDDNDRVVLGDYSFEKVDGGSGFDTLVLQSGARTLNLASALATGRLADIEQVELGGDKTLVFQAGDVTALTGGETSLRLVTTSSDHVNLVGSWTHGSDQLIGGATWSTWTQGAVSVLVQGGGIVTPGSASSCSGLDAIAAGGAAPHPAAADYTDPAMFVSNYRIFSGDFTVDSREIFYSDGAPAFYSEASEWTFTNNGEIYSLDDAFPSARGVEFHGRTTMVNNGLIHVEELSIYDGVGYPTFGVWMNPVPETVIFENHGEVSVYSMPFSAIGFRGAGEFRNDGLISAISENSRAIGVTDVYASHIIDNHQTFFNTGVIYAEAGGTGRTSIVSGDDMVPDQYEATGVAAYGSLTNDGDIIAVLGANAAPDLDAVGVYLWKNYGNNNPNGVTNNGTIQGTIAIKFDNAPGDLSQIGHFVTNNGQIFGDIQFQDADDSYDGHSGTMDGIVFGYGGNDTFTGGKLADWFDGGAGNDTLNGGAGVDTASYADATSGVTVDLGLAVAQDTGGAGTDTLASMENIIGSAFADTLTANGTGSAMDGGDGDDFIFGGSGPDAISGGDGDDSIWGGGGADTINGDSGNDHLEGNADNDTINGGDGNDYIDGGDGNDTLDGGDGNDILIGGDGDDIIHTGPGSPIGGDSVYDGNGNDTVVGGTGDDSFTGAAGNDHYDGAEGFDYVAYNVSEVLAGIAVDMTLASNQVHSSGVGDPANIGVDTLINIEWITGSGYADVMTAGSIAISFFGNAGNDTLTGGAGNDTLGGGDGDDVLNGGAGIDTATYFGAGGITVNLSLAGPQNTGEGTDTLSNIENLRGSELDDVLTGNAGANVLEGGWGVDTLNGAAGSDTASYASAASGVTVSLATAAAQNTGGADIDTLISIENLMGSAFDDTLTGDGNANVLAGGGGIDALSGGGGDDTLDGGAGADTLAGGTGNDRYVVDQQGDAITELAGQGEDMAILRASYALGAGVSVEVMTTVNGSATTAINLIGNELAQSLYGNAGANILMGNGGADYLAGGAGNDVYYVDTSDFIAESTGGGDDMVVVPTSYILRDGVEIETLVAWNQDSLDPVSLTGNEYGQSLYGSQGANSLNGGAGNDYLVGLGGNDFLLGGAGNDNMAGGQGNDIYYVDSAGDQLFENAGEGDDIAVCFASFTLGAGQSVETLSANEGSGAINLTGNDLGQSLYGNSAANVLTGGGGADYMVGGAGNDVFVLTNAPGVATVADYAAGDVVDIGQYLSVANGTNVTAGGYVRIVGSQLQVDSNGGGDAYVTVGNVSGSGSVTIRYQSGGSPTDLGVARSAGETEAVVAKTALDAGHSEALVDHVAVLDGWHQQSDGALDGPYDPVGAHFHVPGII